MDLRDLRHVLEDLNLSRLWEDHSAKITLGASVVVVLVLALVLLRCGGSGDRREGAASGQQYFYDLNTRKLVAGPANLYGPADLGGGDFTYPEGRFGSAVKAVVISCNDCVGVEPGMTAEGLRAVDAKLGYLMRYSPGAREVYMKLQTGDPVTADQEALLSEAEQLYSTPEGKTWLPESSGPASQMMSRAWNGCGERRSRLCAP